MTRSFELEECSKMTKQTGSPKIIESDFHNIGGDGSFGVSKILNLAIFGILR